MDQTVISVSILPQKYFIEKLAGDHVVVNVMIPPGASPASYEPTISQLSKLNRSGIYMKIGNVGFEKSWMEKISSINPQMKVVDLSEGIEMVLEEGPENNKHSHGHTHGGIDPHIWMSVLNAKIISKNIYNELLLLFPEDQKLLSERYETLAYELDSLHLAISKLLTGKANRSFLIYHPALTYFARDYDLEQWPIEIEGKTPSPAHMKRMIDLSLNKNINTIFIQSQFDQNNAEVLAKEIGAKIIQFNPLDVEWKIQMLYIAEQFYSNL